MFATGPSAAPALQARAVPERLQRATLGAAVLVAVFYYVGAKIGFALTPPHLPISLLWPPNAVLMAALLLTPPRQWWVLVAAVLPAHLAAQLQSGVPMAMILGWFASNCSEALLAAGVIRLLRPHPLRFDSFRDVSVFLVCGAFLAPLVSSFLDVALVKLIGWGEGGYWELVHARAPSNILAALTVVPLVLTWASATRAIASTRKYVEAGLLFAGLLVVSLMVFHWLDPGARETPALFYAPLPFMLWAAVRLGPIGVSTANLVLTAVAIWGAVKGLGPFVGGSPEENAHSVQYFLIAVSVPLLLLAALLDERRRVEREAHEQRQQLTHLSRVATLGGLSGALAHELNQPLTAILSNAQAAQHLLAAGRVDLLELDDILRDIVEADRRASNVIRRLRSLFKDSEPELQPLDVNELVREVLDLAHGDLATRHISVVTHLQARLPTIRSDRIQMQQVLLNLVVNACEAMSEGAAERRVLTAETCASPDGGVQISFIDRGPGFRAGHREKLFEPFYTTKPNGLGLGLSISRSIVSAHGGRLWGTATPGEGAAFHIALPAARSHP